MKYPLLKTLLAAALLIGAAVGSRAAVDPLYVNNGSINSPQVDATVFLNNGVISAFSTLPFSTTDTLYYTNHGSLVGSDGFVFSYSTNSGSAPALSFFNDGSIEAYSVSAFGTVTTGFGVVTGIGNGFAGLGGNVYSGAGSYLFINSEKIQNSGYLAVDSTGQMSLTGTNVNLAYAGLRAGSLPGASSSGSGGIIILGGNGVLFPGFFSTFGDVADQLYTDDNEIYDVSGSVGTNNFFRQASLAPPNGYASLGNPPGWLALAYTNQIGPSNILVQVFFVNTNNASGDPAFSVQAAFADSFQPEINGGKIAIAKFNLTAVDPITGAAATYSAFALDDIATITNAIIMTNSTGAALNDLNRLGVKPSNLAITYGTPPEWQGTADQGNTPYSASLLTSTNYVAGIVTNLYSTYSAAVAQSPSGSPNYSLVDPTNYPGSIHVNADTLDLTDLRILSLAPVFITANSLTNTSGAAVLGLPRALDTEFVNLNLGSPKSPLVISHYVPQIVHRLNGTVSMWSASWTNFVNQVVEAGTTNASTNVITVSLFATVVDQNFSTAIQGSVVNFALHSKNADIQDAPVVVTESISLDVTNLTISGSLFVTTPTNIDFTVCPHLASLTIPSSGAFTNNGPITLGVNAAVQASSNILSGFTNQGFIQSYSVTVNSGTTINSGQITASAGPITLQAGIAKLDFGTLAAQGNVNLVGSDFKGQGVTIQSGGSFITGNGADIIFPGSLNLSVTNVLEDGGASAGNAWVTYGGFNLFVKPLLGDLLGTTLTTFAAGYGEEVVHSWAGADLGANAAVSNDVVLGALYLDSGVNTFGQFLFKPVGASNAIYTAVLGFNNNVDLSWLQINPGLVIYFGSFSGAGVAISDLTNAFPGQLVYVPGLGSSASPLLRRSLASAGSLPQGQAAVRWTGGSTPNSVVSWAALGGASYQVQFATNLFGPWTSVFTGANNAEITLPMQATFTPSTNNPVGFYRVQEINQ